MPGQTPRLNRVTFEHAEPAVRYVRSGGRKPAPTTRRDPPIIPAGSPIAVRIVRGYIEQRQRIRDWHIEQQRLYA